MTLMSILLALVSAIAFALAIMLYLMTLSKKRPYDPIEFPPPETRVTTIYSDHVHKWVKSGFVPLRQWHKLIGKNAGERVLTLEDLFEQHETSKNRMK